MLKIIYGLRTLILCDVIAYHIAKLLYHLEFLFIQVKKFPETCNSWPSKLQKRYKLSVFWPQMMPEAKLEAKIEAGRVNLAKEQTHNQKSGF